MPRGFWDYGVNPAGVITAPVIGLAELAARLGSPVTFDRQGEVLAIEDYERGLGLGFADVNGAGSAASLVTAPRRSGGYALQLVPGNGAGLYAAHQVYLEYPGITPVGAESWIGVDVLVRQCVITLEHHTPSVAYRWELRYDRPTSTLQYLNAAGAYVSLASVSLADVVARPMHVVKLVGDPITGRYVRAWVAGTLYDLSAIPGRAIAAVGVPQIRHRVQNQSDGAGAGSVYVDDIILTHNEP